MPLQTGSLETGLRTATAAAAGISVRNSSLLCLGDAAAAVFAFALSGAIGFTLSDAFGTAGVDPVRDEAILRRLVHYGVFVAGLMLWLGVQGHYSRRIPFWLEMKQVLLAVALAGLLDGFSQYAFKQQFSRLWLGVNWALLGVAILLARQTIRQGLAAVGAWQCPTVLVGSGATAEAARLALASDRSLGYEVVGLVDLPAGDPAPLWQACRRLGARFVVVAPEADQIPGTEPLIAELARMRVPYAVIPPIFGMSVLGLRSDYFFSHDIVLLSHHNNLAEPLLRAVKRAFDMAVACALLALLAPFFLVTTALIQRDGGPAFFGHRRIGMNGRPFRCLKFRTMVPDAGAVLERLLASDPQARAEWEQDFKLRNDPRITPIGRFLRRTSLDELPQLLNVVRGEMSLVGPRPVVEAELERYGDHKRYYLETRPGITGLWQVSGRNDSGYGRRVQLDVWYVRNWSLWHDVTILAKTVRVVLSREGAY